MAYYDGSAGVGTAAQLRDAFNDRPLGRIIPGSFNISRGGTTYHEGVDYTVDYVNATITPLHADLAVDISEGGQFDAGPNGYYSSGNANSVSIRFEYIGTGSNIYGEAVSHHGNIMREIEVGVEMPVNITSNELFLNQTTGQHTMDVLLTLSENLLQNNSAGINQNIGDIDNVFKTILAAQSKNGARINRFDTTLERNEMQFTESTRLLAEVEDAEFAETVANFNLLQTVYDAALRSGAKIIQPSLVNFL
jgi:flagellin-like hook-associated protein FlgL